MESVVEQNSLSSFHGMISSFHGMIPSYHDMISSYHAVFGLRHRDKAAKVIGLSGQTRGERDSTTGVFSPQTFTMADANVYNGGCKRLRWQMQTFAMADANVYGKKHILLGNQILSGQYLFPEHPIAPEKSPGKRLRSCPTWSGNLSCEQWPADKRGRRQGPRLSSCDIPDWDDRHPLTDNLLPRTRPLQNRDSFHWAVWER